MRTLLLIVLLSYLWLVSSKTTVDIYTTSVKATFNKTFQRDLVFTLKTGRKIRTGIINFSVFQLTTLTNPLADIKLFYRYGTIYREYLIHPTGVEGCQIFMDRKKQKWEYQTHPLVGFIAAGAKTCCKQFLKGCPYLPGWYNFSVDVNATASPFLPSIVPAGYYKLYLRVYTPDNYTINTMEGIGYVKPNHENRAGDFTMLNMG